MGALHEGHLSLIRKARKENDIVAVSIFVNPLQFGPKEDLKRYPRPLKRDLALCRSAGADLVFTPRADRFYPADHATYVTVEGLSDILCGSSRPGHFRGVATVVMKLLNVVRPDRAYFGMKDLQQTVVIRRMVRDMNLGIQIVVCPIVREPDGLALSSRNVYLSPEERQRALVLHASLLEARKLHRNGERDADRIRKRIMTILKSGLDPSLDRIEYAEIADMESLESKKTTDGRTAALLAIRVGRTRLIDNMRLG
jgi:pantoate--beta-alanine ligase